MLAKEKRERYEKIVKTCYGILAKYASGIKEEDWETIFALRDKFDLDDPLAKGMWFETYEELARQYREEHQSA
jgi:hypothetical protein